MTASPAPAGLPPEKAGKAYALLAFTMLCWGGNAVLGQVAVGEISPMMLVFSRWAGVVILIALFMRGPVRDAWPQLRPKLGYVAFLGVLGFTCFNALFYIASHSTKAINIGIIQGSMPIFVLIGSVVLFRAPVRALQLLGVVTTIIGISMIASAGDLDRLLGLSFNPGDLFMLIACLFYSAYILGLRRCPPVPPMAVFTVLAGAACIAAIPLLAIEAALGSFQWPTATGWFVVLLVTLFPSFIAQIFFIRGVELIGPGRAGVFINLVPVFASLLAVTFLGEAFELYHALALALVLGGIALSEKGKPKTG